LIETGEAYVFLDGATGTLNELFLVWEMANRKLHTKPVLLLGKRLQKLVKFLKKDPALKIPESFYLVSSVDQTIKLLGAGR
jgi:predicted Rossmann-fold nucleotide-binding protein